MSVEEPEKIIRNSGESLCIEVCPEEEKYRSKYLPDLQKLTDDKLVCTVCSVSLASSIHKGSDMFIHRVLRVLVCEACYNFYGDGCFSTDEDGDDKYCRWCGQGGTLYLCSACTCAFCQKCVKQNLKASVLSELENDDWVCYICNPRPLFGCRTICWGAEELNKIGKAKEQEKLKKLKERKEKMEEKRKEENGKRSRKASTSEDELSTKKRRVRGKNSDSSSPEVMPTKRTKRDARGGRDSRNLNGSTNRGRKKRDASSSSDTEDTKRASRKSKSSTRKSKQRADSSSEDEFVFKNHSKTKPKKKKGKESSDEDQTNLKRSSVKKKELVSDSDDESSDGNRTKKSRLSRKKEDASNSSENEKRRKTKSKKKKETSSDESSDEKKKKSKKGKKKEESSDEDSDDRNYRKGNKSESSKKGKTSAKKIKDEIDSDNELKTKKDREGPEESMTDEKTGEVKSKLNLKETADNAIVKKRIKLAVLWLSNTVRDISELSSLISLRATKFSKKKINTDYLKTYEDVLNIVSKLKQLISGVHSNYDHIEKSLEAHLKPWKIMTGLEESEIEKTVDGDSSRVEDVQESTVKPEVECKDNSSISPTKLLGLKMGVEGEDNSGSKINQKEPDEEMTLQISAGEESDNDNATRDLISKARETLDKEQTGKKSDLSKNSESILDDSEIKDSSVGDSNQKGEIENEDESVTDLSELDRSKNLFDHSLDNDLKDSKHDSDEDRNLDRKNKKSDKIIEKNSSRSRNKENKKTDDKESLEKSKTPLKTVEETDSEAELETSGKEKKSPSKKEIDKKLKGSSKDDGKGSPSKEHKNDALEEKRGSPGKLRICQNGFDLNQDSASSSDEFTTLATFSKRLKEKWISNTQPKEMNLKTSLGIESSGDSDEDFKPSKEEVKSKDLKRTKSKGKVDSRKKKEENVDREVKKRNVKTKKSKESDSDSEYEGPKKKTKKKTGEHKNTKKPIDDDVDSSSSSEENNRNIEKLKKKVEKSKVKEEQMSVDEEDGEKVTNKEELAEVQRNSEKSEVKEEEDSENNTSKRQIKRERGNKKQKSDCDSDHNKTVSSDLQENTNENKKENKVEANMEKNEIEDNEESDLENAADEYSKYLANVEKTKFVGLESSSEEADKETKKAEVGAGSDIKEGKTSKNSKGKEKSLKKRSEHNKRLSNMLAVLISSDEEDEEKEKKEEEDSNKNESSDEEETKKESKKERERSASPVVLSSGDSSDSEIIPQKKIRKKSSSSEAIEISDDEKPKKKRRRIKCADSSDESGGSDENVNRDEKSTQGESPGKGGRKNIKKIKTKSDLADATKEAAEEEKERRRRIEERQKLFNQMFEIPETTILDKLVLDFDPKEKKELVSVNEDLVAKMKPHQAKGVKFMWDSCYESLSQLKTKKGSGCILAHCMGLGKTFQVISLVHTVLTHKETDVHTVMVVCPLSTVLNWANEFDKWLDGIEGGDEVEVFHLTRYKTNPDRARELRRWQHNGGVLIIGYEMFRNLSCESAKKFKPKIKKDFQETLIDPGADLIVCDEGHMLKNEATALSKAMSRVKTLRRIVLTGTPMQNNLKEYHCMVQFVKPNLLGTRKEFLNRFVNPITNGQFVDSTESDVKVMKRRAHVLHKMLEGLVQRFDYNVLTPFLPPKHEYVISVCLSELQVKLYKHYLDNFSQQSDNTKAGSRLFQDWQALGRIWTHPRVLKMSTDRANWLKEKKALEEDSEGEEGSLKDFIDDEEDTEAETTEESSDNDSSGASIKSDDGKKKKKGPVQKPTTRATRATRSNKNSAHLESSEDEKEEQFQSLDDIPTTGGAWWSEMVDPEHLDDINHSAKLVLLFAILKESEMIEDKVLVFSQSLFSLDLIEYFLDKIDEATQKDSMEEKLGNHHGTWSKGLDYFRLDGSTSSENRNIWCKAFNRDDNPRARLFLISTRAGGLGINLTAANRVIIFDASWNPSHDVQSIFRVYRFGQKKPCYVYRFIAHGTMEEKVYDRQVAKQSMSNRVVDEQQVHRHFSMNDLNELYSFTPPSKKEDRPIPALPKDSLLAEILKQFSDWIEKYHEHDSLLENVVEEELNEEERKAAWEDYETEKKRGFLPQNTGLAGASGMYNMAMNQRIEYYRQALKAKYPNKSEQELNQMLVYQISLLMKQQQMQKDQAGNPLFGMMPPQPQPQFVNNNLTQEQLFNLQQQQLRMQYLQQQMQMRQAQAQVQAQAQPQPAAKLTDYQKQVMMQQQANLAMLQMKQMQQQQQQQQQKKPHLSNILLNKLSSSQKQQPAMTNQYPKNAFLNFQKQDYEASKPKNPGVTITEITDDPPETSKPSDSST